MQTYLDMSTALEAMGADPDVNTLAGKGFLLTVSSMGDYQVTSLQLEPEEAERLTAWKELSTNQVLYLFGLAADAYCFKPDPSRWHSITTKEKDPTAWWNKTQHDLNHYFKFPRQRQRLAARLESMQERITASYSPRPEAHTRRRGSPLEGLTVKRLALMEELGNGQQEYNRINEAMRQLPREHWQLLYTHYALSLPLASTEEARQLHRDIMKSLAGRLGYL